MIGEGYINALDPRKGSTLLEKYGPFLAFVAWLGITVGIVMGWAPVTAASSAGYGVLSALVGGYLQAMKE